MNPIFRRLAQSVRPLCFLLLAGGRLAAAEGENTFPINVRAVVDRPFKGFGVEPLHEHGKSYAIVSIKQIDNPTNRLARPVNEFALLKNLRHVLATHGFREAPANTRPEIILTVLYGRGWLRNPYLDDSMIDELSGGIDGISAGGARVVIAPRRVRVACATSGGPRPPGAERKTGDDGATPRSMCTWTARSPPPARRRCARSSAWPIRPPSTTRPPSGCTSPACSPACIAA
ncbi:MAG: hypothetical protein NT173_12300 [Opitutales bacterium]|nr:hypothetical protein [Opitutales bacterium]